MNRSFYLYASLFVTSIIAGLLSRASFVSLPPFLSEYSGDTIWAMMVFWMFCCIRLKASTLHIALMAITFSFCIELSQLYHAPWIDAIRGTKLGGLVLGFGFKYSDLTCYSVGVCIGALIDWVISKKRNAR